MHLETLEHLFFNIFDVGEAVPGSDVAVFNGYPDFSSGNIFGLMITGLTTLRLRENRMRQSFFDNEPESKWSRSVPERLLQMASHESPRTTKFYDRTRDEITQ
jgi:hypothetical protein